jgi:hypothetical protein
MQIFFNVVIIVCLIATFLILLAGLIHNAKSGDKKKNKVNKFMRYRVTFQFVSLLVLTLALYFK